MRGCRSRFCTEIPLRSHSNKWGGGSGRWDTRPPQPCSPQTPLLGGPARGHRQSTGTEGARGGKSPEAVGSRGQRCGVPSGVLPPPSCRRAGVGGRDLCKETGWHHRAQPWCHCRRGPLSRGPVWTPHARGQRGPPQGTRRLRHPAPPAGNAPPVTSSLTVEVELSPSQDREPLCHSLSRHLPAGRRVATSMSPPATQSPAPQLQPPPPPQQTEPPPSAPARVGDSRGSGAGRCCRGDTGRAGWSQCSGTSPPATPAPRAACPWFRRDGRQAQGALRLLRCGAGGSGAGYPRGCSGRHASRGGDEGGRRLLLSAAAWGGGGEGGPLRSAEDPPLPQRAGARRPAREEHRGDTVITGLRQAWGDRAGRPAPPRLLQRAEFLHYSPTVAQQTDPAPAAAGGVRGRGGPQHRTPVADGRKAISSSPVSHSPGSAASPGTASAPRAGARETLCLE